MLLMLIRQICVNTFTLNLLLAPISKDTYIFRMFTDVDILARDAVSDPARRIIADLLEKWGTEPDPAVSRKGARARLGGIKNTKEVLLEKAGEIDSFLSGYTRLITIASIYRYL